LHLPTLENLSLCNNGLSAASMNEVAEILISSKTCERLKKLHFFNNMSGDGGCAAFVRILEHCTSKLIDIRFSGTRAQRKGSLEVAVALQKLMSEGRCNIEYLDLADNSFGVDGAGALSSSLHLCTNMKYLDLRDCLLEDEGIQKICQSIGNIGAVPLQYFDVSGNDITKDGAQNIASILEKASSLKIFRGQENELTSIGVKQLVKSLPESIEELYLGCNQCGSIGATAVVRAHKVLKRLRVLSLDENMFSTDDILALQEAYGDKMMEMEDNISDDDADFDLIFELESSDALSSTGVSIREDGIDNDLVEGNITNYMLSAPSCDDEISNSTLSSVNSSQQEEDVDAEQAGALMTLEKEWTDLKDQSPMKASRQK